MMRDPIPSDPSKAQVAQEPRRSGSVSVPLSEPPAGRCSVFPGGVAISYGRGPAGKPQAVGAPDATTDWMANLTRVYFPSDAGYVIGYSGGRFGKISFSCVRIGEFKTEEPSAEEISRFRSDLAEAGKKDLSVALFIDLNPQVMG